MKPTEKQIAFVMDIYAELGAEIDIENMTKEQASKYICEHINEYKESCKAHYDNWALAHGYF